MSLFKTKFDSKRRHGALNANPVLSDSKPIKIEITLSNGASQTFRFGTKIIVACVVLTVVSALWGSLTAWWIAWEKLSGTDIVRQKEHAKILVDEITEKLDVNRTNDRSEKLLLTQIRDKLDRLWKATEISNIEKRIFPKPTSRMGVLNQASNRIKVDFSSSLANEKRIQAEITSSPTTVYSVKHFRSDLPVGVDSISHFALQDSDVIKVGLTAVNSTDHVPGEILSLVKYDVDGSDVIVSCCGLSSLGSSMTNAGFTTVQFNFRKNVSKFMEVLRPKGNSVRVKEVKIGIASGTSKELLYSRWLKGTCLKDCIDQSEPDIPTINLDPPRVSQNHSSSIDTH